MLELLADVMRATSGGLRISNVHSKKPINACSLNVSDEFNRLYHQHYFKTNVFLPALQKLPMGEILPSHRAIDNRIFKRTEYYNDFVRVQAPDIFYFCGGNICQIDDEVARFAVHRSQKSGPFEKQDYRVLKQIMPHLGRALKLANTSNKAQIRHHLNQATLENAEVGVAVYDSAGKLAGTNSKLDNIVAYNLNVNLKSGLLVGRHYRDNQKFATLVRDTIEGKQHGGTFPFARDRNGRFTLNITVLPVSWQAKQFRLSNAPSVIVMVKDCYAQDVNSNQHYSQTYDLTSAEISLTQKLLEGMTLNQIAEVSEVSRNTLKTQLGSVFVKTGTNRQADLVRLLLS